MTRSAHRNRLAIGLFGGTFDPVHYGHLRAALESKEALGLKDFRLLPAGTPALRSSTGATATDRLEMLRLAVADYPDFTVDDREVRRRGKSYMVDTLREIRKESGDVPVLLMIGQDAANELDRWHEWRSVFGLAHLVIMGRPDSEVTWQGELKEMMETRLVDAVEPLMKQAAGLVLPLAVTQLAISSTGIREQLATGQSPRFLLPDKVIDYIGQNQLYFAAPAAKG